MAIGEEQRRNGIHIIQVMMIIKLKAIVIGGLQDV